MFFRRIELESNNPISPNERLSGVMVTYRSLVLLIILILMCGLALAGYIYSRFEGEKSKLKAVHASATMNLQSLKQMIAENNRLQRRRREDVEEKLAKQRGEYVKKHGEEGKLHLQLQDAFQTGKWEECVSLSKTILQSDTLSQELEQYVRLRYSSALMQMRKYEDALGVVDAGLSRQPQFMPYLHRKTDILLLMRRYRDAKPLAELIAGKTPTAGTFFVRASVRHGLGEYRKAVEDYRFVLTNGDPGQERAAANNLALLYAEKLKDYRQAEFYANVLLGLDPASFRTHSTIGRVSLLQGNMERASRFLVRALKGRAAAPYVLLNLSILCERLNNPEEAEAYRQKAAKLTPDWQKLLAGLREDLPKDTAPDKQ